MSRVSCIRKAPASAVRPDEALSLAKLAVDPSPRIPYRAIMEALMRAQAAFPNADGLEPVWSPAGSGPEIQVRVWVDGTSAGLWTPEGA